MLSIYYVWFHPFQVAVRGCFLGVVFGIAIIISFSGVSWCHFGWYMAALSFFHWSEYVVTAITNPKNLSLDSYLLDHSREYHIAAVASWVEFWIEWRLFPGTVLQNKKKSVGCPVLHLGGSQVAHSYESIMWATRIIT